MTKNRTPTPVYLGPGMHPGLEVKGLTVTVLPTITLHTNSARHSPVKHGTISQCWVDAGSLYAMLGKR